MIARIAFTLLIVGAAIVAAIKTDAATVTVLSQNTLHLGWGKPTPMATKNTYLVGQVVATKYDVVMMQEVMPKGAPLGLKWQSPPPPPGRYLVVQSLPAGASTYRETYGFLIKSSLGLVQTPGGSDYACTSVAGISRPPCGVLVKTGTNPTWFVNYHAVFGSVPNRKKEVQKIGSAIVSFQNKAMGSSSTKYKRVVAGGDWNFSAAEVQSYVNSSIGGQTIVVTPSGASSLKPNGGLSQPYDHFVCVSPVTCSGGAVVTPPGGWSNSDFRKKFSDHLGVKVDVQYTP